MQVVPATGPQPNVPLLFVLGCCTSGPYQAVGVFSALPRMLQVDTVAEAAVDLQASQVEVSCMCAVQADRVASCMSVCEGRTEADCCAALGLTGHAWLRLTPRC